MGKQVDLVMYVRGERRKVGRASIESDGSITAQVEKDSWPIVNQLLGTEIADFSLSLPMVMPKRV